MSNLNDIKEKSILITLDKERHIKFDLNAFAEIEEKFGDISKAFNALENGSVKSIRTLLWAGLVHEDEGLTEKQVGSLIGLSDLSNVMDKVSEALGEALPKNESTSQNQQVMI